MVLPSSDKGGYPKRLPGFAKKKKEDSTREPSSSLFFFFFFSSRSEAASPERTGRADSLLSRALLKRVSSHFNFVNGGRLKATGLQGWTIGSVKTRQALKSVLRIAIVVVALCWR